MNEWLMSRWFSFCRSLLSSFHFLHFSGIKEGGRPLAYDLEKCSAFKIETYYPVVQEQTTEGTYPTRELLETTRLD